jgi:hypothetical protein
LSLRRVRILQQKQDWKSTHTVGLFCFFFFFTKALIAAWKKILFETKRFPMLEANRKWRRLKKKKKKCVVICMCVGVLWKIHINKD